MEHRCMEFGRHTLYLKYATARSGSNLTNIQVKVAGVYANDELQSVDSLAGIQAATLSFKACLAVYRIMSVMCLASRSIDRNGRE